MRTIRRLATTIGLAALGCAACASGAAADGPGPLRAAGVSGPFGIERLSDERSVTRVGFPARRYKVRAGPGKGFHTIARLRFYTEDRAPENYLVLRSAPSANGFPWLQIRLPQRPNGRKGWVPSTAFGRRLKTVTTAFELDKSRLRARLYKDGRTVWMSSVGIGAPATPTPDGRYWVRERLSNLGGSPAYGPFAFGTAAYSRLSDWPGGGVVGIHGTDQPGLIPGRPSHGCIRIPNAKILQLKRLMPVGTPVWIHA
jgi:L,D-transpeptidase catalytic domain